MLSVFILSVILKLEKIKKTRTILRGICLNSRILGHSIKIRTAAAVTVRTHPEKEDVHESIIIEFLNSEIRN